MDDPPHWRLAEDAAAAFVRSLGFREATATPVGADAGLDVVGSGVAAQVKTQLPPVGRPAVQRLRGAALDVPVRLFFSTSGYTTAAIDYADEAGVALFNLDGNLSAFAVNSEAVGMSRKRRKQKGSSSRIRRLVAAFFIVGVVIVISPLLFLAGRESMRRAGQAFRSEGAYSDGPVRDRLLTSVVGAVGSLFLGSVAVQDLVWSLSGGPPSDGNPSWGALLGVVVAGAVLVGLERLVQRGLLAGIPLPRRLGDPPGDLRGERPIQ